MCPLGMRQTVIFLTTEGIAEGVLWMCPLGGRHTVIYLTTEGMEWMCPLGGRYTVIYINTEGITKVPLRTLYTEHRGKYCDNCAMTLVILFLLKTMESLENCQQPQ